MGKVTRAVFDASTATVFADNTNEDISEGDFRTKFDDVSASAAFLEDVNTFSKQQRWKKGADVASATVLPLIEDGNYFDVTGTVTVTSFADLGGAGTVIILQFDAACILTHHITNLILPTGGNITTAAGDHAIFVNYASGDYRCVNYQRKDGTALVGGDVTKVGTPVNNQVGVWTSDGNLEGDSKLTFDGTTLGVTGGAIFSGILTLGSTLSNGTYTYTLPSATGTLALTSALSSYVPITRTLTINNTSYDLSADRTWTLTTSNISEGSNLYYTDTRARAAISLTTTGSSGASTYTSGVINIPTYTLSGLGGQVQLNGTGLVRMSGTTVSYDNATYATQSYVTTAVANLVNSAPSTLDTLNELAAALGDDPNFATTVTNSIATKLPLAGGTLTGTLNGTSASFAGSVTITGANALRGSYGAGGITTNFAAGDSALSSNTTGQSSTAIGFEALIANTVGVANTAIGSDALGNNTTGFYNTATGSSALGNNTTASNNTATGRSALGNNTVGSENTAIGRLALQNNTTGSNNTALGYQSGLGITTGSGNTVLGANVAGLAAGLTNNIILADGTGAIKAQHDGTDWALTGGGTFSGALSATSFSNAGLVASEVFNATKSNAGYYVGYFQNTSATGLGLYIRNGLDTNSSIRISNAAGTDNTIQLYGSGKAYFAGDVGIGTSSPSSRLSLSGTDTTVYSASSVGGQDSLATLKIQNLTSAANSFASIDFNTNNNRVVNRIVSGHGSSTSNGFLAFVTEGSSTPAERMRITSNGNVGIGTDSPTNILHTYTSSDTVGRFESTDSDAHIRINDNADSLYVGTQNQKGYIGSTAANSSNNLTIDLTNGNVGIGTTTDAGYKLDVNGTARVSGAATFSGNVGIGTTFPARSLEIAKSAANAEIELSTWSTTATNLSGLIFQKSASATIDTLLATVDGEDLGRITANGVNSSNTATGVAQIFFEQDGAAGATYNPGRISFYTATNAAAVAERMRITSGGEVYIAGHTDQGAYNLQCNGTGVWGAGAYVNGSDLRLKEDIKPILSGLDYVNKMNPVSFKYLESYSRDRSIQTGFIAQELIEVFKDEEWVDGIVKQGTEHYNVAYQAIIPVLVKAIQEQQAIIEDLKTRIEQLEL